MLEPMTEAAGGVTTGGNPKEGGTGGATPVRRATVYWEDIRTRAFKKWEAAGNPPGDCTRFWLEAERELLEGR